MVVSAAITYQGRYPDIYTSFYDNGPNYLNLYSDRASRSGYKGAVLGVPNSGAVFAVTLTNDQVQALGNAIRLHLATGSVNQTIAGVQLQSSGSSSINITVVAISYTINFVNDEAARLATSALQFVTSGAPHSPSTDPITTHQFVSNILEVINMAKKSNYDGPWEQKSIHDSTISGLPKKSDGSLRKWSNAVAPIVTENVKPVNPEE